MSFESYFASVKSQQYGSISYETGVLALPQGRKYALFINKVVWYALRLVVELDERSEKRGEVMKLGEFLTYFGAKKCLDEMNASIIKGEMHPFAGYYLEMPDDVQHSPDKYLKPGDFVLIKREKSLYNYHHAGIYAGGNKIIHISVPEELANATGTDVLKTESCVNKTSWRTFYGDTRSVVVVFLMMYKSRTHQQTLEVAESQIGSRRGVYNLLKTNCQSFAGFCQNGFDFSPEVYEVVENINFMTYKYKK